VTLPQDRWTAVDDYSDAALVPADPTLDAALQAIADAGLPEISVSPAQGKLLNLLALGQGARRILEIGTLGGYSAIWLARALPSGGRLITLEADPRHAEVARANLASAGLGDVSEVRVGQALDTLFIDADKPSYADYLAWSVRLSRPGTMIVADNVVRGGAVIDAGSRNASVRGVRRFIEALAAEPRVGATVVQTVGRKGYDGFALAVVQPD
jgi:predicted O-methyltransferase YrrM